MALPRSTRTTEEPPDWHSVACKESVEFVEDPPQERPACRCEEPTVTDGAVSLPEHRDFAHDTSVWENAMNDPEEFLPSRAIARRVKTG